MKKTILLSAITFLSIMAATTVKAQYYKSAGTAYNHGYNSNASDAQYRAKITYQSTQQAPGRPDIYNDLDKLNWLKQAIKEDAARGNWDAYRAHEAEIERTYADGRRDREETIRADQEWHREHDNHYAY